MKILCDIGNTFTKILFISDKVKYCKIKTLKLLPFIKKFNFAEFYISTVVDEVKTKLNKNFKKIKFITHKDVSEFIKIKYDTKNLGSDRIISAFCCKELFGGETLIISCGSTIVLDYINKKCEYVGGEIFPGIKMLITSLYESTSKLPLVKKLSTNKLIGKNTKECISSGIINFCFSGIRNFVDFLKPKNVVITGGDGNIFFKKLNYRNKYKINNLVLLGIVIWGYYKGLIYESEVKKILSGKIFSKIFV